MKYTPTINIKLLANFYLFWQFNNFLKIKSLSTAHGFLFSYFYSLKKLHEIQLIISPSNVFYHSNLERNLVCDSVIGTQYFAANQFDLNFIWQQMENSTSSSSSLSSTTSSTSSTSSQNASPDDSDSFSMAGGDESLTKTQTKPTTTKHLNSVAANTAFRNYQYFTKQSAVDYKSSSQLIFDVLMQMIEVSFLFSGFSFSFFFAVGERGGWFGIFIGIGIFRFLFLTFSVYSSLLYTVLCCTLYCIVFFCCCNAENMKMHFYGFCFVCYYFYIQ